MELTWTDTNNIILDRNILFSKGYNFFGLENLREEAKGTHTNFLIWKEGSGRYSLYLTTDGGLYFDIFKSEQEAKDKAQEIENFLINNMQEAK